MRTILQQTELAVSSKEITLIDEFKPAVYGLDAPEAVIREIFITRAKISSGDMWDSGRRSVSFAEAENLPEL